MLLKKNALCYIIDTVDHKTKKLGFIIIIFIQIILNSSNRLLNHKINRNNKATFKVAKEIT